MSRILLCGGLALILAACGDRERPPPLVQKIPCPSEAPPELPALPERSDDLRDLAPDRLRIEGLWEGFGEEWDAYRLTHSECPELIG